jgi:hypothetical protein
MGALVAAALLSLTPPGQSLAAAVGDLVGIGHEPSGGPQLANPGETREDTVIAAGTTPSGDPFELVASNPDRHPGKRLAWPGPQTGVTDLYANFPDADPQAALGLTLNAGVLRRLAEGTWISPALATVPGEESVMVNAFATPDIERLALIVDGNEVPMTSGVLEPYSADDGPAPVRYGVGFVPDSSIDVSRLRELAKPLPNAEAARAILDPSSPEAGEARDLLGSIEVVGFDADGNEVYRQDALKSGSTLGVLLGLAGPPPDPSPERGGR